MSGITIIGLLLLTEGYVVNGERAAVNTYHAMLIYLNFQPLEVVSRYRDPQLQVAENYAYLLNLGTNICKSWMFRHTFHSLI